MADFLPTSLLNIFILLGQEESTKYQEGGGTRKGAGLAPRQRQDNNQPRRIVWPKILPSTFPDCTALEHFLRTIMKIGVQAPRRQCMCVWFCWIDIPKEIHSPKNFPGRRAPCHTFASFLDLSTPRNAGSHGTSIVLTLHPVALDSRTAFKSILRTEFSLTPGNSYRLRPPGWSCWRRSRFATV